MDKYTWQPQRYKETQQTQRRKEYTELRNLRDYEFITGFHQLHICKQELINGFLWSHTQKSSSPVVKIRPLNQSIYIHIKGAPNRAYIYKNQGIITQEHPNRTGIHMYVQVQRPARELNMYT